MLNAKCPLMVPMDHTIFYSHHGSFKALLLQNFLRESSHLCQWQFFLRRNCRISSFKCLGNQFLRAVPETSAFNIFFETEQLS